MLRTVEQALATVIVEDETETIENDMEALVREAALKLDEWIPDWFTKVNTGTLNMADGTKCILGQAAPGGYGAGVNEFCNRYIYNSEGRTFRYVTSEGELCCSGDLSHAFGASSLLLPLWQAEIQRRLLAQSA